MPDLLQVTRQLANRFSTAVEKKQPSDWLFISCLASVNENTPQTWQNTAFLKRGVSQLMNTDCNNNKNNNAIL